MVVEGGDVVGGEHRVAGHGKVQVDVSLSSEVLQGVEVVVVQCGHIVG